MKLYRRLDTLIVNSISYNSSRELISHDAIPSHSSDLALLNHIQCGGCMGKIEVTYDAARRLCPSTEALIRDQYIHMSKGDLFLCLLPVPIQWQIEFLFQLHSMRDTRHE